MDKKTLRHRGNNFNCTIQELKRSLSGSSFLVLLYFNCTIQELKLKQLEVAEVPEHLFQLHHTGIKTFFIDYGSFIGWRFQLHHTGIKTVSVRISACSCAAFQLHHTGIKTLEKQIKMKAAQEISIAPYRN